ncbi:MAG: hypothetical protein GY765_41785, partial [bacterium]|nr:hypothetical protein [bacterium]
SLDKELTEKNRAYFFAFKVGAPRDKKKFLASNNIESFISKTIPQSLEYLTDKQKDKKSAPWFEQHVSPAYKALLEQLKHTFYTKSGKDYVLDYQLMEHRQQKKFLALKLQKEERQKNKIPMDPAKLYADFLLELFRQGDNKEPPTIFLIKINGKHILEFEEYRDSYINIVYYDLLGRFAIEDRKENKYCHLCETNKDVVGSVPLPLKFYGTTNSLYFEHTHNKNAYKAFALCRDCLYPVMVGMKYTEDRLNDYLFGLNCYLVPSLPDNDPLFEKKLKGASSLLKTHAGSRYQKDIDTLTELLEESADNSFSFSLMFYHREQQSFDILKMIADIRLKDLMTKMALFDEYTEDYELDLISEYGSLKLTDIRNYIFPSKYSHKKADFKTYGKELLGFLENFLNEHPFSFTRLISAFTTIYARRFHMENIDSMAAIKMVMFLSILHRRHMLKEGHTMKQDTSVSQIHHDAYTEFLGNHAHVYESNAYRQGLFLLGTVISRIVTKQKKKRNVKKAASTFLSKINYNGIPPRRVSALVRTVKEYADIYDIDADYEIPGLWGNIMDRLQEQPHSPAGADEVVFYILTGISYEDYLRFKGGMNKKNATADGNQDNHNQDNHNQDNDNQDNHNEGNHNGDNNE